MTTEPSPPTLPPNFEWKPAYLSQLRHISETDEFLHDEEQQLPSSSSTSSPSTTTATPQQLSGAYDWGLLKDAIKYRIKVCLEEEFGGERKMDLHPASVLIPYVGSGGGMEFGDVAQISAGMLGEDVDEETMETSESETKPTDSDTRPSEPEIQPTQANGSVRPPYVSPADTQNFYPSKRPPSSPSHPPLTPSEITTHLHTLFGLLDDFDIQPPFTIQRLCELVVSPTAHYHSAQKWIGAVKRCLSVTATRDAFPISPVQGPIGVGMNGVGGGEDGGEGGERGNGGEMSEVEMDRMDGLPPSSTASVGGRSRSSSVASSSEPLFSPIPFVVRDENGHLTHSGAQRQPQDGEQAEAQAESGLGLTEQIPDLELGGADRTHAADVTPREVVDVAPQSTPTATATATLAVTEEKEGKGEEEVAPPAEQVEEDVKMEAAPAVASSTAEAGSVAGIVDATHPTPVSTEPSTAPPPPSTAPTASEPLGVPDGEVDELDNPSQKLHALTSTTTATPVPLATATTPETQNKHEVEEARSSKRRKSIASIHDARD